MDATGLVTVYWRPGCPYCALLRRRLRRTHLPYTEVDIWSDPEAAAYVRSVAGGNETVPTVRVGDRGLVNPGVRAVFDAVAAVDPAMAGAAVRPRWNGPSPGWVPIAVVVTAIVVAAVWILLL